MKNDIRIVEKTGRYRIVVRRASKSYSSRNGVPQYNTLGFVLQKKVLHLLWITMDSVNFWGGTYPGYAYRVQNWCLKYGFGFDNYFEWLKPKSMNNPA